MNYKRARDLAWEVLLNHEIKALPVDVFRICSRERITVFSYKSGASTIEELGLQEHIIDNDAFSVGALIFYDGDKPLSRIRFSVAHELGHIFLHYDKSSTIPTVYNREPSPNDDPIEAEANIFASRLLAPLSVLQFLNLNSAKEISELCGIGYTAASLRFARLCEIRRRSAERKRSKNHGTFLISRLERRVIENFRDFIEANKKSEAFTD